MAGLVPAIHAKRGDEGVNQLHGGAARMPATSAGVTRRTEYAIRYSPLFAAAEDVNAL